jgi:hypothetical protein
VIGEQRAQGRREVGWLPADHGVALLLTEPLGTSKEASI